MKKTTGYLSIILTLLLSLYSFDAYSAKDETNEDVYNVEKGRINDQDKKDMTKVALDGLEQHKKENGGKIDLTIFKPNVMEELYGYYEFEHIDRKELLEIKRQYEILERESKKLSQEEIEKRLVALFEKMMAYVNDSALQCVKEGEQCNSWGCCNDLVCAAVPNRARQDMGQCQRFNQECKADSECCSGVCGEGVEGKKVCAVVRRCYRPQRVGQSCDKNPTCESGNCEAYNEGTIGIGECKEIKAQCRNNSECCSGKCKAGKCRSHFICKDCVEQGKKPRRGQKCCEGLYKAPGGKCIPVLPPFVKRENHEDNYMKKKISFLGIMASFLLGEVAHAQVLPNVRNQIRTDENTRIKSKINGDEQMVKDQQMKNMSGMSKRAMSNQKISSLDDFKNHEMESYNTRQGTDFNTCFFDLKTDYLINLQKYGAEEGNSQNMLGVEMSVLAFEFMTLGSGTQDYWKQNVTGGDNIYTRARAVAERHRDKRHEIFNELDQWQIQMECLCWDAKGYPNLSAEVQPRYQEQCPQEYAAYLAYREANPNTDDEDYAGDASGVKGKYLITQWTNLNKQFYARMGQNNFTAFTEIYDLASWLEGNDWGNNEEKTFKIWRFTTRQWRGNPNIAAAVTLALLAAGVVAISGGFATATMASLWLSFGVIAGAGTLGAGGMWLIGAMKGAWESRSPYLQDEHLTTWKCGKKSYCSDFERSLILPKSKVCANKFVSSNGCIKNFLVTEVNGEERFLVDPWVPVGVEKNVLIKDTTPLANRMSTAAERALDRLRDRDPNAYRKNYKSTSYLKKPLLDSLETGYFSPALRRPYDNYYKLNDQMIKQVKDAAKKYALDEKYLFTEMNEDLDKFADYVFDYHFVWPRLSQKGMIAYPMPGMVAYFNLMAEAMNIKTDENDETLAGYNQLHTQHLQDYQNTINGFNRNLERGQGSLSDDQFGINQKNQIEKDLAESVAFTGMVIDGSGGLNSSKANIAQGGNVGSATNSTLGSGSLDPNSDLGKAAARIRKKREIMGKQKEKMAAFKKALGEEKANQLIKAKESLKKGFFSPLGGSGGSFALSIGGAPGTGADGKDKKKASDEKKSSFTASTPSTGRIPKPSYNLSYNTGGSNNSYGSSNSSSPESEKAQEKIKEAIEFRDQNPAAFDKQEGDTLFKIITRTYIRNYDKLLKKRKKRILDAEDY